MKLEKTYESGFENLGKGSEVSGKLRVGKFSFFHELQGFNSFSEVFDPQHFTFKCKLSVHVAVVAALVKLNQSGCKELNALHEARVVVRFLFLRLKTTVKRRILLHS